MKFLAPLLAILLFACTTLLGQEAGGGKTAETLVKLGEVISETSTTLKDVRTKLKNTSTEGAGEEEAQRLEAREEELASRLAELKAQFNELATGVAEQDFTGVPSGPIDLGEELKEIARPGLETLKELTERPRETEELRSRSQRLKAQRDSAKRALDSLEKFAGIEGAAGKRISDLGETWRGRHEDAKRQLEALELVLAQREQESRSVFGPVSKALADFFRGRGLNLLKALAALAFTWFILRWIWHRIERLPFLRKINRGEFGWRLIELSVVAVTWFAAASAAVLVLYFSGDWLLLTIFIVMLAGLIWGAKSAIPRVAEQTKMLLNLGPVRKGERLNFEGVPWEVGTIGVYTELRNAELTGGLIRVSLKRLTELRSRPLDAKEAWFPTKTDDWILINDNLGKVVTQTPEYVQILRLGGARETFPTPDFLSLAPLNLSNNFRVKVRFGIDYDHQSIATTKVPLILKTRLEKELYEFMGDRDLVNSVSVEFAEAGASSLDYDILADFKGAAASRYQKIRRTIQRVCVDVCNEQKWVIPFTQVTVHQAPQPPREEGA